MHAQILYTVTHLGVADALAKGPKTAEQLATTLGEAPACMPPPSTSSQGRRFTALSVRSRMPEPRDDSVGC